MDRKLLINLCILGALILLTIIVGVSGGGSDASADAISKNVSDRAILLGDEDFEEAKEQEKEVNRMVTLGPLMFVVVIYTAILFIIYVLPNLAHRATHAIYDSSEMVEEDPLHDARALFAQGDYEGSIEAYRAVAEEHTGDRFPWVEMAKIYNTNLEDPDTAIAVLREAMSSYDWQVKDAAFMMFRVAELYENEKEDKEATVQILQQVVEMFPETRHSANATHRLRELDAL